MRRVLSSSRREETNLEKAADKQPGLEPYRYHMQLTSNITTVQRQIGLSLSHYRRKATASAVSVAISITLREAQPGA